ncbi:hypothetical protein HJG54_12750 [Leptolyngbya sp. NK1-12]|uniref:Uncharacterized protein n=1 Tax=Leptolyngbya sp. NK1-12 TaxID=2547451 RepID=A0AA96WUQ5_9CYAN|nr:hypothetical protein [Leptolyngbya sp. NK1-12]WNZ23637.1 hypothetical protein HJG54_12750 [Leptolyngbya sp. NK1-12]
MSSFSDSITVPDATKLATNTPPVLRINHRATLEAAKIQRQAVHPSPPLQMVQSQIIPSQIIPLQTVPPQIIPSVPSSIEWIQTQPEEAAPLPAHRNHIHLWDALDSSDFPQSQSMASPAAPLPLPLAITPQSHPGQIARLDEDEIQAPLSSARSANRAVPHGVSIFDPLESNAPVINIAELAEQVSRILARQLAVERERRGIGR